MNINTFYSKLIDETAKIDRELEYIHYTLFLLGDCQEDEEGKIGNILETMYLALSKVRKIANSLEIDIEDRQKGG